jgi:predicted amidohydrolase
MAALGAFFWTKFTLMIMIIWNMKCKVVFSKCCMYIQIYFLEECLKSKIILCLIICMAICAVSCEFFEEGVIMSPWSQHWRSPPEYDESGATKSLHVAAVSLEIDTSPEVNCNKIVDFIDKIKAEQPDVRLILFPETALGYYYRPSNPLEYQTSVAETIPGLTTNVIAQKAIEHQIYISFGMAEKLGDDLYNSQVLIAPDGTIASVHHKYFLMPQDKESGFKAGQDVTFNIIDGIKVATIICRDINSFEINKKIHNSGAELILLPLADEASMSLYVDDYPSPQHTYTWKLSANRIGNEDGASYSGSIALTSPSGEIKEHMARAEGYIYGVVKCW